MPLFVILLTLAIRPPAPNLSKQLHNGADAALTVSVEQVPVGSADAPVSFQWEALSQRLSLKLPHPDVVAKQLARHPATLCPRASVELGVLVLLCETPLMQVSLRNAVGHKFLELRQTRGLPFREYAEEMPIVPFDPVVFNLGKACPGSTPIGEAECALAQGDRARAEKLYRDSATSPYSALAQIRLGELALLDGETSVALEAFKTGAGESPFGRLAKAHLCELTGGCFASHPERLFDTRGVPAPLAAELTRRLARLQAFTGEAVQGATLLSAHKEFCQGKDSLLCQRVLLAALLAPSPDGAALTLYLASPLRELPPLQLKLAQAAAQGAEGMGAPAFAATLLSAATPSATPAEMPGHLLRIAELYRAAGDDVRASVVLEFAQSRLGPSVLRELRWKKVLQGFHPSVAKAPTSTLISLPASRPEDEAAPDLAKALLARSRAEQFLDAAPGPAARE